MKELLTYIAENMVGNPNAVEVTEKHSETGAILELKVAEGDLGRVIGKGGRTAKEIRTIIRAANRENGKVMVEFID